MGRTIAYQPELSPTLPTVVGNVDYAEFEATLSRVQEILDISGVEQAFVEHRLEAYEIEARARAIEAGKAPREISSRELGHVVKQALQGLRCNIARELTGEDCRTFSTHLAESALLRHFCLIDGIHPIRVPSKSTIDRYSRLVPQGLVREVVDQLTRTATGIDSGSSHPLGLAKALDMDAYFLDSTCVKANIHFPTDWVLLRDATRTLMRSILVIRSHGLKHRIEAPETFITKMNRLSIAMTQAGRKKDDGKERKRVLRLMNKLMATVRNHAVRYRQLLQERWPETLLSQKQAEQILKRMDAVLEVLPQAIEQAKERIVRGRQVANPEKILSLYEPDIHVVVRGKAGAKVEFGNVLFLGETPEGVIVDWKLVKDRVPSDATWVRETLERYGRIVDRFPSALATDRGFDAPENRAFLSEQNIYNAICPKSIPRLREKLSEDSFVTLQKRRAQTEARVGIFQNGFLGKPMRSKGFLHRESNVAWAVLAHNLWVLARLKTLAQLQEEEQRSKKAA